MTGSESIGFIGYSCFHLRPGIVELGNWIRSEEHCGKGFGVDIIIALEYYLHEMLEINALIMAPSVKNIRAIWAYEKAGF